MLQTALRPVQKNASRILLAGANAAADWKEPGPEAPSASVPALAFAESGLAAVPPPRPPTFEFLHPAVGPLCMRRQESLRTGAVQSVLGHTLDSSTAHCSELRTKTEPESPPWQDFQQDLAAQLQSHPPTESGPRLVAGSPYLWHMPVVGWPVFWPAAAYTRNDDSEHAQMFVFDTSKLDQQLSSQPQQHRQEHSSVSQINAGSSGASSIAAEPGGQLGISMPSRTASTRRQRRRQRVSASALQTSQDLELADPDVPGMLWPATPEYTPPSSPRAPELGLGWPAVPVAQAANPPQAEVEDSEHLLAQLSDAAGRLAVMEQIIGRTWQLAATQSGCRVVQKALEVGETAERVALSQQLHGHVWEACTSPHANHVLQKCIELIPADRVQFVLTELKGHAAGAARHRYGCRVLERLIEHCSSEQTAGLLEEVLNSAPLLCRHTFGNFVIQHILVHGMEEQRQKIAAILCADIQRLARHRVASHVVRCALVHCSPHDRQQLALSMSVDAGEFADLAHHHCGSFVVREMKRADSKRR